MNSITITEVSAPIGLVGTHNFRSTAGYPATGGVTRANSLFRSDALHKLDDAGREQFDAQGIVRVIDLRDNTEREHAPNAINGGAESVHHPILDETTIRNLGASVTLASLYEHIARERAEQLVGAVRLIAEAPAGGVLVHCTAGKDRTGMVVATALTAVGVSREQVIADYSTSATNLAGEWAERMIAQATAAFGGELSGDVQELVVASPGTAIAAGLDEIEKSHGGVEAMLRKHGFDDTLLAQLRSRLVAAE